MKDSSISIAPTNTLTLKGLTTKQKDGLIAGGLTLGAVITGVGFYQLFGKNGLGTTKSTSGAAALNSDAESIVGNHTEAVSTAEEAILNESSALESVAAESSVSFTFNSAVNISESVSDDMDFDQAFASARQDVGAGGFFNYRGDSYSTFYKDEWDGMSSDNQDEYFAEVQEQSVMQEYETPTAEYVAPIHTEAVVDTYEVVEEVESFSANTNVDPSIETDDFFAGLEEEVTTEAAVSTDDIVTDDAIDNTNDDTVEDAMADDDFFSDINENESTDSTTEEATDDSEISIDNDDFFSDLDDSEETQSESTDVDNTVVVRPVYGMDQDGDDVIDMIAIDANEDGIADVVAIDDDNDGDYESFMINQHGGDNLDVFIIDEGNDGIDASDPTESIDNVVSMEDFIVLDEEDVQNIEDMELIESLIDGTDIIEDEKDTSDNLEDNDFDEIGL